MAVRRRFRHTGLVLVRATTCPPGVTPPSGLDLADPAAVGREGPVWLAEIWTRHEVREAVEMASPVLATRINRLLATDRPSKQQLRRAVVSVATYLLRWERRATPFGTFAGVTTAAPGPAAAKIGTGHRAVVRADAEWLTGLINHVEQNHALRMRLTVVTDNTGAVRDGYFLVSQRAQLGARSPGPLREASVRLTTPVVYALDQATAPLRLDVLAERMSQRFPSVATDRIHRLLHGLIDGGFLITNLHPASTVEDPLNHVIQVLRAADVREPGAQQLAEVAGLLGQLEKISAQIAQHNTTADASHAAKLRAAVATTMCGLASGTQPVLATDVLLDAHITLPQQVVKEAEHAADVLLRLSTQPFGTAAWMDYHARFRAHYGPGALVPVRDLLADSGLGYPHGFLGAPRARPAWRMLTERDATLMTMIQQAIVEGAEEITLTDTDVLALTVGDHTDVVVPPRVEVGVTVHATSPEAIDRGDFELRLVCAPRAHTSILGRFAYLLDEADHACLTRTYSSGGKEDVVVAQLSFPPRRPHNDNVVRVLPYAGTVVLSLGEHPDHRSVHAGSLDPSGCGHGVIEPEDLAVTADAAQMYLVQCSTGRRVVAHIPHALDTLVQMLPLARFLAEVADARSAVFGPIDPGAARTLPYVPRIRYRRTVLSPARWLLSANDLPTGGPNAWEAGLRRWQTRWKVPARIVLCQADTRLPLDLDQALDRGLLRNRLDRADQIELREDAPPDGVGWVGRAAELVIPMISDAAPRRLPVTAPPGVVHHPGDAVLLRTHLIGNPARFDTILARHLPTFIAELNESGEPVQRWWAGRHRDLIRPEADQYLVVLLRLTDPSQYGQVTARLAAFAADLQARGLLGQLMLSSAVQHPGRYGHGPALETAEEVFATDTAAAIAQITMAEAAGIPGQAVAAASMTHLAAAFAPDPSSGYRALTGCLKRGSGPVDAALRDHALCLADPIGAFVAVRALPGGDAVAAAWQARATALTSYHRRLAEQRNPASVLATLLHEHHVRAFGLYPDHETTVGRLTRAAALRNLALAGVR